MSVEVLRRAADEMRKDWGESFLANLPDAPFHLAVADWLEKAARGIDRSPEWTSPATVERVYAEAFAVAHAYLGEPE